MGLPLINGHVTKGLLFLIYLGTDYGSLKFHQKLKLFFGLLSNNLPAAAREVFLWPEWVIDLHSFVQCQAFHGFRQQALWND